MKTSITTRLAAAIAAALTTFAVVLPIADYAYPEQPAPVLAFAAR